MREGRRGELRGVISASHVAVRKINRVLHLLEGGAYVRFSVGDLLVGVGRWRDLMLWLCVGRNHPTTATTATTAIATSNATVGHRRVGLGAPVGGHGGGAGGIEGGLAILMDATGDQRER